MTDYRSTNLEGAAYLAHEDGPGWAVDDRPTRRDCERDESREPYRIEDDVYRGKCGGCGQPVSAFAGHAGGHEGSCLWKGGPWHPSCRAADQAAPERDEDPMFDILRAARADEEAARDTYGDRAVDRAIGKLLAEPGL